MKRLIVLPLAVLIALSIAQPAEGKIISSEKDYTRLESNDVINAYNAGLKYKTYPLKRIYKKRYAEAVYNNVTKTRATAFAIDKRTLLTNYHNVNTNRKLIPQHVRINIGTYKKNGAYYAQRKVQVVKIIKIPGVDGAILKTKEDISKYMDVLPIAPESKIKNMKIGTSIKTAGYPFFGITEPKMPYETSGYVTGKSTIGPEYFFKMPVRGGQSGSPVMQGDKVFAVACLTYNIDGARMTKEGKENISAGFTLTGKTRNFIYKYKN